MQTFLESTKRDTQTYMRFSKVFQPQQAAPQRDKRVQAVRTTAQLLDTPERIALTQEIQDLSGANAKDYQTFYASLINRFADFVQLLASFEHPAHTWLDTQLRIAKTSLKMREQFLLVGASLHPIVAKQEALWHYVVFSSALLRRIGLLFTHYQVSLCNEQGQHRALWRPFAGPISTQASYYKLQDVLNDTTYAESITHLLAKQIMPDEGFAWIASDKDALMTWLGIVEGERGGGVSHQLVILSEKLIYEQTAREAILEEIFRTEKLEELLKARILTEKELLALLLPLHGLEKNDTEQSIAFYDWLNNEIKSGALTTNQANSLVQVTPNKQYLIAPEVLALYAQKQRHIGDVQWFNMYKNAVSLGLNVLSASDRALGSFLVNSAHLRQGHERSTAELFHQALQGGANTTQVQRTLTKDAITHGQTMQENVASINTHGFMLSSLFNNVQQTAHLNKLASQAPFIEGAEKVGFQQQDRLLRAEDSARLDHLLQQQQQSLETRQRELRSSLEKQYQERQNNSPYQGTSFTYMK